MKIPRIILVIATSLDGRIAFPSGGESHIGSSEDKKILNNSLSNVDATLFGSGTLKAHKCTYLVKHKSLEKENIISKKQPISIVAGNIRNFSTKWHYFQQPITRWLVSADNLNYNNNFDFDRKFGFKKSWLETLKVLHKEDIKTIALLGGTKLISSFAKENLIDEIKITFCPKIIGGKFSWISLEEENKILNINSKWKIEFIKALKTNEIFVHYTKENGSLY